MWYRAQIMEIEGDMYEVQYIDYGNVNRVKSESIRRLDEKFYSMPQQAFSCALSGINSLNKNI